MASLRSFFLLLALGVADRSAPRPRIVYVVRIDSSRTDAIDVTMRLRDIPPRVRLAMKVHPEYDAHFWRYVELLSPNVRRVDSTLWEATSSGDSLDVRYRIRLPAGQSATTPAWRTSVRVDGALLNPPDLFLYPADLPGAPSTLEIHAPASWSIATALDSGASRWRRRAPDAATLLDSPIMLGSLHVWALIERGVRYTVAWWPRPNAPTFDSASFVSSFRALARSAVNVFDAPPAPAYWLLVQDAGDALEHRASLTIGIPSEALARDPRAHLLELAHEFFHSWNLVAIHPDDYGSLHYTPTPPTGGLWWGEGVTMHYADVLPRRAGLTDSSTTRRAHLESLLERYYAAPWATSVSPEAASLAFGQSPLANSNATGGYYLQGELLGEVLDAAIRDSTRDTRSLDDAMRALFRESRNGTRGFTAEQLEAIVDSVCSCQLRSMFAAEVHSAGLIDIRPAMHRLGWRVAVDTVLAVGPDGAPLPDLRVGVSSVDDSTVAFVRVARDSPWGTSGVRAGDVLRSVGDRRVATFNDYFSATRNLRVDDSGSVTVSRLGSMVRLSVPMMRYRTPHVRLVDETVVSEQQRTRRARWLAGW